MTDAFDKMVSDARAVFDASASKPLRDAWAELSLVEIRKDLIRRLREAGIDEAETDARILLAHCLAPASFAEAVADPALSSWQAISALADLSWDRLKRRPMAQILGSQPFWTLDFLVTADTLAPRPDTETLVEAVLKRRGEAPARVLDLGTGSGAILLSLLSERPAWTGLGVDLSAKALDVARRNARRCALDSRSNWAEMRWGTGLGDHGFDILVANPPYIKRDVLANLAPEVRDFEPALALDGGPDGLEAYRDIINDCRRLLLGGGLVALEIGYDQAGPVMALAQAAGLEAISCLRDLAGHDRVIIAQAPVGNS